MDALFLVFWQYVSAMGLINYKVPHTPVMLQHNLTLMFKMPLRRQCYTTCKLPKGLQGSGCSLQNVNKPGPACHHTKPPAAEMTGIISQKTYLKSNFFIPLLRRCWILAARSSSMKRAGHSRACGPHSAKYGLWLTMFKTPEELCPPSNWAEV